MLTADKTTDNKKNNPLKFYIMKKGNRRIIWDSDLYFDGESMNEWAKANVERGNWDETPDEDELWDMWRDEVLDYWHDERANLNCHTFGYIVAVADLGFWDGRTTGIRRAETDSLNEILWEDRNCDFVRIYADDYNIRSEQTHHDGTHRILYRFLPWDGGDEAFAGFLYKAVRGKLTIAEVVRKTQSLLPYVAGVYGWDLRNYKQREKAQRIAEEERKRREH